MDLGWFANDGFLVTALKARRSGALRLLRGSPTLTGDLERRGQGVRNKIRSRLTRRQPISLGAWSYDAVHVLARAIDDAKSVEPEKLRQAILSVKGYAGAEGVYNFDKNGDGLHGYNVVKNNNGVVVFDRHIDFDD